MCSDHTHIHRLAQVHSNTLIVFTAPNRLCDYEELLHQNVRQHAVFPIAHVPAIIPLRATVDCRLPTPGLNRSQSKMTTVFFTGKLRSFSGWI